MARKAQLMRVLLVIPVVLYARHKLDVDRPPGKQSPAAAIHQQEAGYWDKR